MKKENITDLDRSLIKKAMKKKIREKNGKIIRKIEVINNEYHKPVAKRNKKIYARDIMDEIGIDHDKYNNIIHGIIRVKDLNYEKLINYFEI